MISLECLYLTKYKECIKRSVFNYAIPVRGKILNDINS